jgi:hypothetical protein
MARSSSWTWFLFRPSFFRLSYDTAQELQRMTEYVDAVTAVMLEKDPEMLQEANKRRIANVAGSVCPRACESLHNPDQAQQSQGGTPAQTPEVHLCAVAR